MLYLESPAGVGFSYSVNESFYDLVNDEMTGFSTSFYAKQHVNIIITIMV